MKICCEADKRVVILYSAQHTDLEVPKVSKKSPLRQNGLQINRKCLRLFVRYSSCPFLSVFCDLGPFSCILLTETQKSSRMLNNYLVDFMPILYQKVKIYFLLTKKHPLASIDVMQLKVSFLKSYFGNLFWTLLDLLDQCGELGCHIDATRW